MTRRPRRSTVRHDWQQVRVSLPCSRGHDIARGEWVRFSQAGYQRLATCATCLFKHYGIVRPNSTFGFNTDPGVDVRARQAGDE